MGASSVPGTEACHLLLPWIDPDLASLLQHPHRRHRGFPGARFAMVLRGDGQRRQDRRQSQREGGELESRADRGEGQDA